MMKIQYNHLLAFTLAALLIGGGISTNAFAKGHFAKHHPRRAEVLHRDRHLNKSLKADKGHLGGHYKQIASEDRAIRHQEQRDARANGGYITKGEKRHLNHEENRVRRQMNRDKR